MAHSLEARSPLLDQELAAFAAQLPETLLFHGTDGKALVRYAYRDVLPSEVLTRPKMGFGVPLGSWLRAELRRAVEDLLLPADGPLAPWFHHEPVAGLVRAVLGGDDAGRWRVWNLLSLAGWLQVRGG
jgi:asparagine synthase (glutamine-hydrolysing)